MPGGTLTLIVASDASRVETELHSGKLSCPHCRGELRPWGNARTRLLRLREGELTVTPRRGRCSSCSKTSVLLPDRFLERRLDEAAVIGAALRAKSEGKGFRKIALMLARPAETVRGWLRRLAGRAASMADHFRKWALALDPRLDEFAPQPSAFADALEAIGLATRAPNLHLHRDRRPPWSWASAMTGGRLLSNTNRPFPQPP